MEEDITKIGPVGLKGLKGIGQQQQAELSDYSRAIRSMSGRGLAQTFVPDAEVPVGMQLAAAGYGESTYDDAIQNVSQLEDIQDIRAQEQPWYAQLGAGVGKGVSLAVTTFLDGTLGLITGLVEGIGAKINGDSWGDSVAKLWNNEVSNGLADLNKNLEEWLPNYRTYEELDNPWYKNLGTMNFWADNVIKNIGFTVGAFYSGSALTKALKALGTLKGAMGAKVVGSFTSALNEGRIEANHGASDFLDLQFAGIVDASIKQGNSNAQYLKSIGLSDEEVLDQLSKDDANIARITEDARDRANAMGLTTLLGNTVLLSLDNFDTFGKLYARGYKNARTIAKGRVTREAMSEGLDKAVIETAQEEAGKRITKEAGKYIYDPVSKKRALARGLRHGLVEGNEEMAQAFIAETAGNMQSPDSPDAYYEALLDPTAKIKTRDFIGSVTDGFVNTYGNGDRWEEFAVGAFTGMLGIPTFGKVQNSDVNTWLGRGKTVGISGGLFGEFGTANKENMEGQEAVDFMNNYAQRVQEQKGHFVRSQSFTDAMDGWAEADDAFEYKNAEDNSDFAAISRFAKVGRINDLRDMVNQDFENLPDEELAKIAEFTSPADGLGGWRNMDGSLMSDTEEGRAQMREELKQKRNKMLAEIDRYENSVETVRAVGNNSLTEDQINELAWLNWKVGTFTDRYNSIKEESQGFLAEMQGSLQAFQRGRGRGMVDEESEEGQKILKAMDNAEMFIDALRSSKTPLQLAAIMEANPHITQFIEEIGYPILEDIVGVDAATFEKSMTDLKDAIKIAKATKTFNQRYKEFRDNPIELIKNRQKIDKKKEKVNRVAEEVNLKDKVNNADVSAIVHVMESGDLDEGQLDGLFSDEDNEFLNNNVGTEGQPQPSGRQKVEEAKKIIKTSQRMDRAIDGLNDGSSDPQALEDAHTLLQHSKQVSESEQEMLDTASQAYNDPTLLYDENDPSMQGVSQEELESVLGERIDAAKSVIEQAKAVLSEQNDELDDLPEGAPVVREITPEEAQGKETGHDATEHTPTENERQKAEAAQRAAQALSAEEQAKVNNLFQDLKEGMPQENVESFDKAISEVLKSIDMLIEAKATNQEIGKIVKNTQSYQTAKQLAPKLDDYLNVYVTSRLNPKATESAKQEEEPKIATPVITDQEVRQQTTAHYNSDPNQSEDYVTYNYWKPTITQVGLHNPKGDNTPYYVVARYITSAFGKDPSDFTEEEKAYWRAYVEPGFVRKPYTLQQLKRMEAVYKYMTDKGAFNLVNSGVVQGEVGKKTFNKSAKGDNIGFAVDASLNSDAGETVILITDSQGRILGDVMSTNDPTFERQIGLKSLVERVTREYQEAGSPQYFVSKETSIVDKNMVGRPPYLADHEVMHTLNEVFVDGEQQMPFKIAVAVTGGKNARILASAGRTKRQGQSKLEQVISPPLSAKVGQPFLLLPTSDKSGRFQYVTVPFMMDSYSPTTQGTALGKAIHKVLERVPTSDNAHVMGIINDLEELLSVQETHINYNGDNVKVTIKPNGAEHQMTIYNGAKNAPNIVEQLELGLQGQPFQVSRKYMNEDYDGQDYNRMIGEVAKVNLPIGTTHTVGDWFTIKPINAAGQKMKTKSPRSTGSNPHAATPQYITITKKGIALNVSPTTWEVTDSTGKVYTGPNTNKVKAKAFGMYMNKNMEQPYDTEWGYYDPKTDEFVEKPNKVLRTLGAQSATIIMVPTMLGGTREETVEEVPYSQLKTGDLVWWSSPTTTNPVNYIKVEGIENEDVYGRSSGGPIILPKGRTYYRVLSKSQQGTTVMNSQDAPTGTFITTISGKQYVTTQRYNSADDTDFTNYYRLNNKGELETASIWTLDEEKVKSGKKPLEWKPITAITPQREEIVEYLKRFPSQWEASLESQEILREKAKKAGLLGNATREVLWPFLTHEQQSIIANKKGPKQKQWMDILELAFNPISMGFDETKLKGTVDEFLGRRALFSRTDEYQEPYKLWNKERELQWLQKALPNLSTPDHLTLAEGLIRINDSSKPEFAYGKFQEGMITISDVAASGTAYHEAFHAVVHTLLNTDEYQKLFDAASERWKDITDSMKLEEELAEDFRRFMQSEEEWYDNLESKNYSTIRKTLTVLFHKLKNLINELSGKTSYINKLYYSINRGKFARRKVDNTDITRFSKESYTHEMQSIKEKAIANGTFMKAPNGKPTNLTEKQWLQVRTKAFKDWFGDWENNPKNASKVIDENDEPLVVYHYTDNENLTKFSTDFDNYFSKAGGTKKAIFFTKDNVEVRSEDNFLTNRKKKLSLFLNIRNLEEHIGTKEDLHKQGTSYREVVNKSAERDDNISGLVFRGFDDNRKENQTIYVVHSSNQVKSATDNIGTFNHNNPDIRYRYADRIYGLEQEEVHYRRIEQYHADKMMYNNLSQDDKDYLTERGITPTEYSQMTQLEKEVLFHCKY